jgi:hypothetical protein
MQVEGSLAWKFLMSSKELTHYVTSNHKEKNSKNSEHEEKKVEK